jgi:hypothetical protein
MKTQDQLESSATSRSRRGRALGWTLALVLLAVGAMLAGALLRGPAEQPAPAGDQRQAAAPSDPAAKPQGRSSQQQFTAASAKAAFVAIQRRRGEAFVKVDPSVLAAIYTPTCGCLTDDQRSLQAERAGGYHLEQASFKVLSLKVLSLDRGTKSAALLATVDYGAGRYVDASGNLRYLEKGRGPQSFRAILAWDGRRWRVAEVRA